MGRVRITSYYRKRILHFRPLGQCYDHSRHFISVQPTGSSIDFDTRSGKPTESLSYLQIFDRINVPGLRKCFSNDNLERYV